MFNKRLGFFLTVVLLGACDIKIERNEGYNAEQDELLTPSSYTDHLGFCSHLELYIRSQQKQLTDVDISTVRKDEEDQFCLFWHVKDNARVGSINPLFKYYADYDQDT